MSRGDGTNSPADAACRRSVMVGHHGYAIQTEGRA